MAEFAGDYASVIHSIEEYVKCYMENYNDPSHDWSHIRRVRELALEVAVDENANGGEVDVRMVELASLLHDVGDKKFLKAGESMPQLLHEILGTLKFPLELQEAIIWIIERVSFRTEVESSSTLGVNVEGGGTYYKELHCVQDADRLDAIGAIGIARCFSFNGARNLKICERNVAPIIMENVYPKGSNARNHFYEKLLRIAGMLKTRKGQQIGAERQDMLKLFIKQLDKECGLEPVPMDIYK